MPPGIVAPTRAAIVTAPTRALRARGTAERARADNAYHKSRWRHWGVAMPEVDRAVRAIPGEPEADVLTDLAARLWAEPVRDLKIAATRLMIPPSG